MRFLTLQQSEATKLRHALSERSKIEQEACDHLRSLREGNFAVSLSASLAETQIGQAISSIRDHLKDLARSEQERSWSNAGLAKFSDILRNKDGHALKDLANEILTNVVKYTDANQGALFMLEEQNSESYLDMIACYAYDRRKHLTKKIAIGDGLAGQCVLEREIIYLRQTPADFVSITSGLGSATPREVLISPLMINEKVFGVLELASFNTFSEHKIEFIKKLSESIAASIKNVKESERVLALLNASQQQTEALRAQEEELRQNMEELQATQEEMQRKNQEISRASAEMMSIMKGIDSTMATIEFSPDGTILNANDNFLKAVEYRLDQIKGKHHSIFVPLEIRQSDDYRTFWSRLAKGEALTGIFKRKSSQGDTLWLNAVYNPIFDHRNEVVKVVKYATNITAQEEMVAETKGVLEGINATMATIAFTPSGIILEANPNFLGTVNYSLDQIRGKHHRMFVPEDVAVTDDYKNFWTRLGAGEPVKGVFKRISSDKKLIWLNAIYNPIKNADGQVVKVVKFATDVTGSYKGEL